MPIRHLSLTGFRSYAELEQDLGPGSHCFVGRNAAGKTNLIEALVLLSTGRSHRSAADQELVRWGDDFARASALVDGAGRDMEMEVVVHARATAGGRKRVRINGINRRATVLSTVLRTVLFAPEDMLLIVGSPSLRRALLDGLVSQLEPTAAATLSTYGRALSQRNALLRRIREETSSRDELPYWDGVLAESGARILDWRHAALQRAAIPLAAAHREMAPTEPPLALRYVSNVEPASHETTLQALQRRLAETAEKEVWNGATLVGPHRDDLELVSGGRSLTQFASRGQQRTAILAVKLAEVDVLTELDGRPPVLLLDDVFSELDPERRAHLVRRIEGLPQTIVTTTTTQDLDAALLAASRVWQVTPGSVRAAPRRGTDAGSTDERALADPGAVP